MDEPTGLARLQACAEDIADWIGWLSDPDIEERMEDVIRSAYLREENLDDTKYPHDRWVNDTYADSLSIMARYDMFTDEEADILWTMWMVYRGSAQ